MSVFFLFLSFFLSLSVFSLGRFEVSLGGTLNLVSCVKCSEKNMGGGGRDQSVRPCVPYT